MGEVVRVTRKFQMTIPKRVREALGIRVGDRLEVDVEGDRIVVRPLRPRVEDPVEALMSLVRESVDVDAVRLVEESWGED